MVQRPANKVGIFGENFTVSLLSTNGYRVIDRNFRSKFGEIDIVAVKDDTLVFIEVKARNSLKFGLPEEAVTPAKIRKITKTGEYYFMTHPHLPKRLRIEVVSLEIENGKLKSSKIIQVY